MTAEPANTYVSAFLTMLDTDAHWIDLDPVLELAAVADEAEDDVCELAALDAARRQIGPLAA
jgi:hypothetical protein